MDIILSKDLFYNLAFLLTLTIILREQLFSGEINGFNMKKRYFKKDGSLIWINLTITLLDPLDVGNPRELCMIEDITEKVKRDEEMLYLNCHDVLTGLYNRMFFEAEKKRLDTERQSG